MVVRVRVTGLVVFPYSDLMTPTFLISVYHSFYYDDKSCGDQQARTDLTFYPVKFSRQTDSPTWCSGLHWRSAAGVDGGLIYEASQRKTGRTRTEESLQSVVVCRPVWRLQTLLPVGGLLHPLSGRPGSKDGLQEFLKMAEKEDYVWFGSVGCGGQHRYCRHLVRLTLYLSLCGHLKSRYASQSQAHRGQYFPLPFNPRQKQEWFLQTRFKILNLWSWRFSHLVHQS